ncbi:hypothetical protein N9955_00565 [bacterium]|nr:hypothetical protein [bacterium]
MSLYLALPEYNSTAERAVALVLDNNFATSPDGTAVLMLEDWDELADKLVRAVREMDEENR